MVAVGCLCPRAEHGEEQDGGRGRQTDREAAAAAARRPAVSQSQLRTADTKNSSAFLSLNTPSPHTPHPISTMDPPTPSPCDSSTRQSNTAPHHCKLYRPNQARGNRLTVEYGYYGDVMSPEEREQGTGVRARWCIQGCFPRVWSKFSCSV